MKYLGTHFTITLGAWRIRFLLAIEDEPEDRTIAMQHVHRPERSERTRATRT